MEPKYRIRVEIYDDEVGEVIARQDRDLGAFDDDHLPSFYRTFRQFKNAKDEYEATHYPKQKIEV